MSGEERVAMERAQARSIELPAESRIVAAANEPPCARCGSLRTWAHRTWCEDCDPEYARSMQ